MTWVGRVVVVYGQRTEDCLFDFDDGEMTGCRCAGCS